MVQRRLKRTIEKRVRGPTPEQRETGAAFVWGRVENAAGEWVEGNLRTPEGYRFTALASIVSVERVLAKPPEPGAWTPSGAFGAAFVEGIEGVVVEPLKTG